MQCAEGTRLGEEDGEVPQDTDLQKDFEQKMLVQSFDCRL